MSPTKEKKRKANSLRSLPGKILAVCICLLPFLTREIAVALPESVRSAYFYPAGQTSVNDFEQYCREHSDEIEALRILYNQEGAPITYAMLKDLENKLKMANNHFTSKQLWNSYAIVNPAVVRRSTTKEESDALTNIIQLVRFAYHQIE